MKKIYFAFTSIVIFLTVNMAAFAGGVPTLTVTAKKNTTCYGLCNGSATVLGSDGTIPYSYEWSDGKTTSSVTGLCAGTYTVTLTDAAFATAVAFIVINEPAEILITMTSTSVSCYGGNNGTAVASVSGGTPQYDYAWSHTSKQTLSVSGLTARSYTFTVTDKNDCIAMTTVTINQPPVYTLTFTSTGATCGQTDGTATAFVSGGTSPYSYLWNNGQTNTMTTGLAATNYQITVTDANGCTKTGNVQVANAVGVNPQITGTDSVTCFNACDGQLTIAGLGGTAPYAYQWSNGATAAMINGLCNGLYSATVTDSNGCTSSTSFTIDEPALITITITSTDASSGSSNDGTATANVSGGTPAYYYAWSNGANTQTVTGLGEGTYTVTITDSNGCSSVSSIIIVSSPSGIQFLNSALSGVKLYPNPSNGTFYLEMTSENTSRYELRMFDIAGKVIQKEIFMHPGGIFRKEMIFAYSNKGIFILQVVSENEVLYLPVTISE